jgi:two-component system cell cycle sensor histidine kinase/response regulator CckA
MILAPDMSTGRVMVVDDEFDIVMIIRRYLEKWGYTVDTFTNPQYAYQIFKANPERYSLVLADIRMPEMTGIRLANLMLEVKPDMKIVIMTAFEIAPDELHTQLPTITRRDILQKPFRLEQICNAVKKQLEVPSRKNPV